MESSPGIRAQPMLIQDRPTPSVALSAMRGTGGDAGAVIPPGTPDSGVGPHGRPYMVAEATPRQDRGAHSTERREARESLLGEFSPYRSPTGDINFDLLLASAQAPSTLFEDLAKSVQISVRNDFGPEVQKYVEENLKILYHALNKLNLTLDERITRLDGLPSTISRYQGFVNEELAKTNQSLENTWHQVEDYVTETRTWVEQENSGLEVQILEATEMMTGCAQQLHQIQQKLDLLTRELEQVSRESQLSRQQVDILLAAFQQVEARVVKLEARPMTPSNATEETVKYVQSLFARLEQFEQRLTQEQVSRTEMRNHFELRISTEVKKNQDLESQLAQLKQDHDRVLHRVEATNELEGQVLKLTRDHAEMIHLVQNAHVRVNEVTLALTEKPSSSPSGELAGLSRQLESLSWEMDRVKTLLKAPSNPQPESIPSPSMPLPQPGPSGTTPKPVYPGLPESNREGESTRAIKWGAHDIIMNVAQPPAPVYSSINDLDRDLNRNSDQVRGVRGGVSAPSAPVATGALGTSTLADLQVLLEARKLIQPPKFSGKADDWHLYTIQWRDYWSTAYLPEEVKPMIWLTTLDERSQITYRKLKERGATFDQMWERMEKSTKGRTNPYMLRDKWLRFHCQKAGLTGFFDWYVEWEEMAHRIGNITPEELKKQYLLSVPTKYHEKILRKEAKSRPMSYEEIHAFVVEQMEIDDTVYQQSFYNKVRREADRNTAKTRGVHGEDPDSDAIAEYEEEIRGICYNCREEGHISRDCKKPPRPRPGKPPAKPGPTRNRVPMGFTESLKQKARNLQITTDEWTNLQKQSTSNIAQYLLDREKNACYYCHKVGHGAETCPAKPRDGTRPAANNNNNRGRSGPPRVPKFGARKGNVRGVDQQEGEAPDTQNITETPTPDAEV